MRRILALSVVVLGVAVATVACSQSPNQPSSGSSTGSGTVSTVVDVPLSIDVTEALVGTWNYVGQSVTMPTGGSVGNVKFNWYHYNPRGESVAFGRLYVLDREFLGLPGDLSPSMPGFLGRSEPELASQTGGGGAQGTEYTLPESLVLSPGKQYWFYTDTKGAFAYSFDKDIYDGGIEYVSGYFANPFRKSTASGRMVNGVYVPPPPGVTNDANFRLRGVVR